MIKKIIYLTAINRRWRNGACRSVSCCNQLTAVATAPAAAVDDVDHCTAARLPWHPDTMHYQDFVSIFFKVIGNETNLQYLSRNILNKRKF